MLIIKHAQPIKTNFFIVNFPQTQKSQSINSVRHPAIYSNDGISRWIDMQTFNSSEVGKKVEVVEEGDVVVGKMEILCECLSV